MIKLTGQVFVIIIFSTTLYGQENSTGNQALSVSAYFARGDFGLDQDTDILYLPLRYELERGNWGVQLLLPYLRVQGPGAVLINLGGVNRAVAGTDITTQAGLGDTVASVIYHVEPSADTAPFIDLRLDVKVPTANEERGLGTGEFDYSTQIDVSQYWRNWILFATAGYSFRGSSALYPDLKDGAFAQLGAARQLSSEVSAGFIYDYRQRASSFTAEIQELGPFVSWQLTDRWSITALSMAGFTNASTDFSVLAQLRYSW